MDPSELEQELVEKLPLQMFSFDNETGALGYFDFHGITFVDDMKDYPIVQAYLTRRALEKAGFPLRITKENHAGNGHFGLEYERLEDSS